MKDLETYRLLFNQNFIIMVEDTGRTFNINMHTYDCFALSMEEAIGKMLINRPEFIGRKIQSISSIDSNGKRTLHKIPESFQLVDL